MRRFAPLLFLGASSLFAANQSREELLKNPKFAEAKAPLFETLTPESLREAACSNFNVAGPYAEWVLLGHGGNARPRQAALGSREDGVHEQPRSEQVRPARVPQGLGAQVTHLD
jgi:hypothetical protein